MSDTPLASVIIPAHNHGSYIAEAIRSVLEQGIREIEILVIDDASTDDTHEVVASFEDPRIELVRIGDRDVSVARNTGMRLARGRFVGFLDADDRWKPGKLRRQLALLEGEPTVGAVFTDFSRFTARRVLPRTSLSFTHRVRSVPQRPAQGGDGFVIEGNALEQFVRCGHLPRTFPTLLVRRSIASTLSFPPGVRVGEDLYFLVRLYRQVPVGYIDEPLYEARRHPTNSFKSLEATLSADIDVFSLLAAETSSPRERALLLRLTGRAWCSLGYHHFRTKNLPRTASAYLRALRYPGARASAMKHLLLLPIVPLLRNDDVGWKAR